MTGELLDFDNPWRPIYEWRQAAVWGAASAGCIFAAAALPLPTSFASVSAIACAMAGLARTYSAWGRQNAKSKASNTEKQFISVQEVIDLGKDAAKGDQLWLGSGYQWTDIEASKMHALIGGGVAQQLGRGASNKDGAYWLHSLAPERPIHIDMSLLDGHTLITGTTRVGKAQPLHSKVHTPEGWATMGEMKTGMRVSTPDGLGAEILDVFPQGEMAIFNITLEDGRQVKACGEHLWEVHHKHWLGKYKPGISRAGKAQPRVMTTLELKDQMERNGGVFKLPLPTAVEKPRKDLPIDPYVLGCILGDGLTGKGTKLSFCNNDMDIINNVRARLPEVIELRHTGPCEIDYGFVVADQALLRQTQVRLTPGRRKNPFRLHIEGLGLAETRSWEKHIPIIYKESSVEDRIAILQGLMDTDGTVTKTGVLQFDTVSEQLANDVQEIVWSLGGYTRRTTKQPHYSKNGVRAQGRVCHHLTIHHPFPRSLFLCSRKQLRAPAEYKHGASNMRVAVKSIEFCGFEEAQCILIDHPKHLYLTDNYVVTHNTRCFDLLITQAIARGEPVIIIDPKGDHGLAENARKACELMGQSERFVYFHPAHPDKSASIDPLCNWNRKTELASRVAALIPSETGADPFMAFGWKVLNDIVSGLLATGKKPNLVELRRYIEGGPEDLLVKALREHFRKKVPEWESRSAAYVKRAAKNPKATNEILDGYIAYYKEVVIHEHPNVDLAGLISTHEHNRDHFQKMIASLIPILSMLTSDPLKDLLSPDFEGDHDHVVTDMATIIRTNGVAYLGLDSLADATVGSAIGSVFLADMTAVAGDLYNYGIKDKKVVNIFVDEAAEVINNPTIQLLNKAGGAGFRMFIATQTFADFAARLGDENKARQVLANTNNKITLRVLDSETQKYISDGIPKIQVRSMSVSYGHNVASTVREEYTASYKEQATVQEGDLIPPGVLSELPPLHFYARLSGGKTIKGRLPIML